MNKTIVVEVPSFLKPLADAFTGFVARVTSTMKQNQGGRAVEYEKVEAEFAAAAAEIERAGHAAALSSLDVDAARISVRGKPYNRFGRFETSYYTVAGEVRVERTIYREAGVRNGRLLDPIAVRSGAIGNGWLPMAVRGMAFLMQQGPARNAEKTSQELGRLPYSASSFERVVHEAGQLYREERADIEDQLIEESRVPDDAASVSVSLDRVSVPMEEERKRPPGRPRKDAPKRLVAVNWRMAWCGTVTVHDEDGKALHTIRYGSMPAGDPNLLCSRMAVDTLKILEKRPALPVRLLADGAHEMWNLLEAHFPESVFGGVSSGVDFWHTLEKLSSAAKVLYGSEDSPQAQMWWKRRLRRCQNAVDEILTELTESGMEHVVVGESQPVHEAITYLTNHKDRMNFAAARNAGLPIGSGNVEATCKSLFALRMKRPGSRWHDETGEDIVQLRALALSDRWETAMPKFLATQRTGVRVIAA